MATALLPSGRPAAAGSNLAAPILVAELSRGLGARWRSQPRAWSEEEEDPSARSSSDGGAAGRVR